MSHFIEKKLINVDEIYHFILKFKSNEGCMKNFKYIPARYSNARISLNIN